MWTWMGLLSPGARWPVALPLSCHLVISSSVLPQTGFSHFLLPCPSMSAFLFLFINHLLTQLTSPELVLSGHFTAVALVIANALRYSPSFVLVKAATVCKAVFVPFLLQ